MDFWEAVKDWAYVQANYAEIICESFTEDEVEHLEDAAEWFFEKVENSGAFEVKAPLILDVLKQYEQEEGGKE